MARRLAEMGHSVALIEHPVYFSPKLTLNLPSYLPRLACTKAVHPHSPFLTEQHLADFLLVYSRVLPGVIIPNWSYGAYAACAAMTTKQAEAMRVIGFAHTDEAGYYEWLTYYEPIIHQFVAVSPEIAAHLAQLIPHRRDDIVIRPYAVNLPDSLNRGYAPAQEPLRLVYAGRLWERQKRISDLVGLAEALTRAQVNFHLRIIGDGPDKAALLRRVRALNPLTQERITLEGSLAPDQMPTVWQNADIFILVSAYEGTSIAMLEAMAYGCVPVVTQVSGTTAVIQPNQNGFLAPVGDIATMTHLIQQLEADRAQLAVLGTQACATIAANFAYDDYVRWFTGLVAGIWAKPARVWPAQYPLLPPDRTKINWADILKAMHGDSEALRIFLIKLIARPGLRWLYQYRHLAKRVLE